jgi:Tfp pilus assembly protein PilX
MKRWRELLGNERGTAMALALIILVIMTALAVGLATMGGVEARISAGQSASTRARLLAESGIEYALLSLAGVDFTTKLQAGTVTTDPQRALIAAGTTLPGLAAGYGTFGVTIRNDISAGDSLLTGAGASGCATCAATETGNATSDSNGVVILTSTGTVDGATRVVVAVVQRGTLGINAPLTLPGVQADTTTDSPCQTPACPPNPLRNYSIDGRDWRRTDGGSPSELNPLKLGIATGTGMETTVENGFSDTYRRDYVQGKHEGTGVLTTGLNTIEYDTSPNALTPERIQQFMANLSANPATQIIQSTQACQFPAGGAPRNKPEGLHLSSTASPSSVTITNNCTGSQQINQTVNLGSPTNPQMIYFKGEYDPTSNFVGVGVEGSQPIQGYGILVVEDADMAFFQTGNFRWDGIVLVTGRNVSMAFKGASNTEIRGAVIGNETNGSEPGGYFEFFNRTTASMLIRASKENIDMALLGLYNMRVTSYRETCSGFSC